MKKRMLSIDEWLKMSDKERYSIHLSWDTDKKEGEDIVVQVLDIFEEALGDTPSLDINGLFAQPSGTWAIEVEHPFIFDRHKYKIPGMFLGVEIKEKITDSTLPDEFLVEDHNTEYIWAPERFNAYVDRCEDKIRQELGNPDLSHDDILDILCPTGDFLNWMAQCRQWEKEGIIPRYEDKDAHIPR